MPGMWQVTDRLEAWATPAVKGRRRRYALQGAALIALGVFAVVPGLMEPRVPSLILTGSLSILAGLLTIYGAKVKSPPEPPASCRREAAKLLKFPGETDWEALQAQVRSESWRDGVGIPYAKTWLNNARWKDTPKPPRDPEPPEEGGRQYGWH